MIVSNNSDDATATTKNVKFVMAFTDDKTQDKWAVASAKKMIYKSQLPASISKSIFLSGGATSVIATNSFVPYSHVGCQSVALMKLRCESAQQEEESRS